MGPQKGGHEVVVVDLGLTVKKFFHFFVSYYFHLVSNHTIFQGQKISLLNLHDGIFVLDWSSRLDDIILVIHFHWNTSFGKKKDIKINLSYLQKCLALKAILNFQQNDWLIALEM